MKVIHIFHSLKFSGAEIMYVDAAPLFQSKGCDLSVMATANELGEFAVNFKEAGYIVMHIPMPRLTQYFKRILFYLTIIRLLKKNKYDVVHIHSSKAMWGFAFCAWIAKAKSVYTFHSVFPTHFYSYLYHVMLRWSAKRLFKCRFQSISDTVYNHEIKLYNNSTTKIYNWFGNKRYFPANQDEKNSIRSEIGIDNEALVLISVGGCNEGKRHSDIINALPLVVKKIPKIVYLHLGIGELESEEKALVEKLGISEKVIFCRNQINVRKYLVASDIYIMTSKFEGISVTTIEAMACGIPAVLYNVPGLKDFNANGKNSKLINEEFREIPRAIFEILEDKNKTTRMSKRAREFVNSVFNLDVNANEIYKLYIK